MKTILLTLLLAAASLLPTKADDSFATAIAISPGETAGTLSTTTDVDYFKFTITSAQFVSVATKSSAVGVPAPELHGEIFNSAQTRLRYEFYTNAMLIDQILPAGTYYVKLSSNGYATGTGGYRLLLTTQSGATPFSPSTMVNNLDVYNDQDFYKFSLNSYGLVNIKTRAANAASAGIYMHMELYNSAGTLLRYSYYNTICDIADILNPGDYFVRVRTSSSNPNVGSYSIKLVTPDNATTISNGTTSGSFAMQGDQNMYRFAVEGSEARTVQISAANQTILNTELYSQNGERLSYSYYNGNLNIQATLNPGTYFLLLSSTYSGAGSYGNYSFTLSGASIPLDPEIALSYNSTNIPDNNISPTTAMGTYFGGSKVGTAPKYRTYRITNSGSGTLNIARIAIEGTNRTSFKIATQPTKVLAPGQTTTFKVSYSPKAKGTLIATVVITNDDPNEGRFDFRVKGIGQ